MPDSGLDAGLDAPPVPTPSGGSAPAGGSGRTRYYGLRHGYSTNDTLAAVDVDRFVDLLDNLGAGVLAALGPGTITGGDAAGTSGLTVTVNAWRGILPQDAERPGYAPGTAADTALAVPASSSFVVWAVPVAGNYPDPASTPFDTAESGIAELLVLTDGSTPDGGVSLLSGTSTASALTGLTDLRTFVGTAGLQAEIAALTLREANVETAIGPRYFGSAPPSAVDARLSTLEAATGGSSGGDSGGGDTGGVGGTTATTVYWDPLARTATDATTLAAYIAAQIPPAALPPTPPPLVTDVEAVNILKGIGTEIDLGLKLVAAGLMTAADLKASIATRVDCYIYDPRLYGLDPALIDTVNTTANVSETSGLIG